jgi:ATP-binding cassette, subfamily C, bacterial CydC
MIASLAQFVWRHKGQTALALAAAVATLLAGIGLLSSSAYLISRAAQQPPILDLMVIIVSVRFFALSRAAARYVERLLSHDLTFRWLLEIRRHLYRTLVPRMPALLLRTRSGDLLGRLNQDVDTLQNLYLRVAAPALAATIVVSITVAGLAIFSPILALVALAALLLQGIGLPWWINRRARGLGQRHIEDRAALQADLIEHLHGLPDLLMMNREAAVHQQLAAQHARLADTEHRQARLTGLQDSASLAIAHLGATAVLIAALPLVYHGQIDGVFLALLTLGVLTSFDAVQTLPAAFQFHEETQTAARRMQELEQAPESDREPETPASLPIQTAGARLSADQLRFAYEPDQPVLDHISFTIEPGQRYGLIGPSGVGKSTLAALFVRFLSPDAGTLRFNNIDLQDLSPADLRRQIAVLPQQVHLFTQSLRANLLLAQPDAGDDELWNVLEKVQLADWARQLPHQLDTWLGDHGRHVSGGEAQRLAIARALLKDAPVWILDEPTAHLDAATERQLVDTLLHLSRGKTVLWISHRLAGLDQLDRLLILANGRIAESGTHAELAALNGHYAALLRLQHQTLAT